MFELYHVADGSNEWRWVKNVTLAGLLVERILEESSTKQPDPKGSMAWELSGRELLDRLVRSSVASNERERAGKYKLVIDATYRRKDALLFEICNVWGYADPGWSPLMLGLAQLREIDRPKGPGTPVKQFEPEDECSGATGFVHEFLYLQHGHQGGKVSWGRMGYTNAALLWPPHFEHLLGKIGFKQTGKTGDERQP
jgi:hypothetical protein